MNKYKLTTTKKNGLFQIEALKDFGNASKGDLGGYIEKEANLSQEGNAWVSGDAQVSGDARVYGNAHVYGNAWVYGKLKLEAGYLFGFKWKGETIQEIDAGEGNYLIAKDEVKLGKNEVETKDTIVVGGVTYKRV